jgi:hypothetical protein
MRKTPHKTEHGVFVGACGVDSGQIMFSDPCYVKDFRDEQYEGGVFDGDLSAPYPYTYNGAASATLSDNSAGELGNALGVVVSTGYGDGLYPVYVTYNEDGRIATATIVFIEPDEDDFGDEDEE